MKIIVMYFLLLVIIFVLILIISANYHGGVERNEVIHFLKQNCINSKVYCDLPASEIFLLKKTFPQMTFLDKPEMYCIMVANTKTADKFLAPTWFDKKEYIRDENPLYKKPKPDDKNYNKIMAAKNAEDEYNPPVIIKKHKDFNVFRDDELLAGTKQRGTVCYVNQILGDHKEVLYAGPSCGGAQVVLGVIKKHFGVSAIMFTDIYDSELKQRAKELGVEYKEFDLKLFEIQKKAEEYVKEHPAALLLPFGLEDEKFHECLGSALRRSIPEDVRMAVRRLWCVAGSGTLANIFYEVFPRAFMCVVQVGKKIFLDQIQPYRTRVFIAPELFHEKALKQPPYKSVINYDAKIWQFVTKYGKKGDYIWNVA